MTDQQVFTVIVIMCGAAVTVFGALREWSALAFFGIGMVALSHAIP